MLLGRCSEGNGEPGHVEDDPGAVGADARGAAKVHSAELGRARGFKPGRQRPPMLNEPIMMLTKTLYCIPPIKTQIAVVPSTHT